MKLWGLLFVIGVAALLLSSCSTSGLAGSPNGTIGATPGGVQDMGFARELVANGQVPPAEAFVVEGMFSEHDLPLAGAACERILCLRSALGIAPSREGKHSGWLQVGFSSTIDPDAFERQDLSIIFVVDISGSMSWSYQTPYNEYQTPLDVSKQMMEALLPTLTEDDEVAIVTYGSQASTALAFTNDMALAMAKVQSLETAGATYMEQGLQRAYRLADQASNDDVRLMLFTDVQPNVGATTATDFQNLVEEGASQGVGLTVYGVGVGLGPAVFDAMAKVRGGNAFTLFGSRDVARIMENDWPYLASPIAYDLDLRVSANSGTVVAEGYGFPTSNQEARLQASTVFLSKRRGAVLVRFDFENEAAGDNFAVLSDLSYTTPSGDNVSESLVNDYDGTPLVKESYFEQLSVAKTVALALLVDGMYEAAARYGTQQREAVTMMTQTYDRFREMVATLDLEDLAVEVTFASSLLELMEAGAIQGTLYGQ